MTNPTWAVRVDRHGGADAAAALRLRPGIEACLTADALWLRGSSIDGPLELLLRGTGGERFAVASDGRTLTRAGERTPSDTLPPAPWLAVSRVLLPSVPTAALPGGRPAPFTPSLVRVATDRAADVLVTHIERLAAYANTAAELRLRRLAFATAPGGATVVRGTPLPPIAGVRCYERDGIAVPCGYDFKPAVDTAAFAAAMNLRPGDLALFDGDGRCELIDAACFAIARRSAVRATREHMETSVRASS